MSLVSSPLLDEVQNLVDALASEIGRPVGVDERDLHALAYSSHADGIDQVRLGSILTRETSKAVKHWLTSLNIAEATEAVRIPANDDLGMVARVCIPLRFENVLLGYLWLIDEPEALNERMLEKAGRYASQLAATLVRTRRLDSEDRMREREAVRTVLNGSWPEAAQRLSEAEFASAPRYVSIVVRVLDELLRFDSKSSVQLASVIDRFRRSVAPRHVMSVAQGNEVVVILAFADLEDPRRHADSLLAGLKGQFVDRDPSQLIVAVGGVRSDPVELRASYQEARDAANVAYTTDVPVCWDELGAYRSIIALVGSRDPGSFLPPLLEPLLKDADGLPLLETVETYLDTGGDVAAAAQRLFLHRSTLYSRLHRVEELIGCSLRSGDTRLELHLGLRLWRLSQQRTESAKVGFSVNSDLVRGRASVACS